jgi:hypothetical protein
VERVDLRRNAVGTDQNRVGGIGWTSSDETRQKAHAKKARSDRQKLGQMEGACCTACTHTIGHGPTMGQRWAMGCPRVFVPSRPILSALARTSNGVRMQEWKPSLASGAQRGSCKAAPWAHAGARQAKRAEKAGNSSGRPVVPCCPLLFVLPPALVCLAVKQVATHSGPAIQRWPHWINAANTEPNPTGGQLVSKVGWHSWFAS